MKDWSPFRIRFRVPLTLVPLIAGVAVAVPLWNAHGRTEFFSAATHVLAIGAVGMALSGGFFRLARHASGRSQTPDLAMTAGSLASGIVAFGVQALFGTPGMGEEQSSEAAG